MEKFSDTFQNLRTNVNIDISEIQKVEADLFKGKEEIFVAKFIYEVDYDPSVARIEFVGNILFALEPKQAKELTKEWNNKKIPDEFKVPLFNLVLRKSDVKALQLEDEMNLPFHISLPSLRKKDNKEKKKK